MVNSREKSFQVAIIPFTYEVTNFHQFKVGTVVNIELYYFNSSSSKVLMNFFEVLDKAAEQGCNITVNWIYEEEDEDSLEFGEEFAEDVDHLTFNLQVKN